MLFSKKKDECPPDLKQETYSPVEKKSIGPALDDHISFTAEIPRMNKGKYEYVLIQRSKYFPCGDCSCYSLIFNGGIKSVSGNCKKTKDAARTCEIFKDGCKVLTEDFEKQLLESYNASKNPGK